MEDDISNEESKRDLITDQTKDFENLMSTMRTEIDTLVHDKSNAESNSPDRTDKSFNFSHNRDSPLKFDDLESEKEYIKPGKCAVDDLVKQ